MDKKIEYRNGYAIIKDANTLDILNEFRIKRVYIGWEYSTNTEGLYFVNNFYVFDEKENQIPDHSKIDNTEFSTITEIREYFSKKLCVSENIITVEGITFKDKD